MKVCDRCGKPIQDLSMQQAIIPYYSFNISVYEGIFPCRQIDLCEECKTKIINFIKNKEDLD